MTSNLTEAGRKAAESKALKRAEALRANLKRRKIQSARETQGEKDAEPENRE